MKTRLQTGILLMVFSIIGCYMPIKGRVIDAETQQPIEGAVVMVEWTKQVGWGDYHTESVKVAETLSDKDGKFALPGCYSPFVEEPDLTIYKKGYVAWNNKYIFPDYKHRTNFRWGGGDFRMDRFKERYSYVDHDKFFTRAIGSTIAPDKKHLIWRTQSAAEEEHIIDELAERDNRDL